MIDPFILTAWLAGLGIALLSAPIGCFIAWQRLVYFGDTVAHAALLGVVLSLAFTLSPLAGIFAVAVLIALLVAGFHNETMLPSDTLLGILAHSALALGLVILSQMPQVVLDINGLLFGDILAISKSEMWLIYFSAMLSGMLLLLFWKKLMRYVLHADIAQVEGENVKFLRLLLMLMIALIVAISIKLVGILLITSLLILPAASARLLARSPSHMVVCATFLSMAAITLGLAASLHFDTPSGPTIILAALSLLIILVPFRKRG